MAAASRSTNYIIISDRESPQRHNVNTLYYCRRDNNVYVNVFKRGLLQWVPLQQTATKKVGEIKDLLNRSMVELIKRADTKHRVTESSSTDATMRLVQELFDSVSDEKKSELKTKYANTAFFKNRCQCCDAFTTTKKKCIHSDCVGMCATCYGNSIGSGVEECPACRKKQEIECPICCETKKIGECLMGAKCSHGVCLTCFADAYRAHRPIENCPMCRAEFH